MRLQMMEFAGWSTKSEIISGQSGAIERSDTEEWPDQIWFFEEVTLAALREGKLVGNEDKDEV